MAALYQVALFAGWVVCQGRYSLRFVILQACEYKDAKLVNRGYKTEEKKRGRGTIICISRLYHDGPTL